MNSARTKPQVTVIGICGGSASGKTWLADRLAPRLAGAVRLSVDSFYLDRSHLSPGRRARLNFDHPRAIDWPALEHCLTQLRAGRGCRIPTYDFGTHARRPETVPLPAANFVVLDGLWLFRRLRLRRLIDVRVFLHCPATVRLERRLDRDVRERGRTERDVRRQFREQVEPMHRRFVAPQEGLADVCLPHPLPAGVLDHMVETARAAAARPK